MRSLASKNSGWLREAPSAGLVPLLLAQVLIALFCVPETLKAGTEIRRELVGEQLPPLLNGEKKVTIVLAEGGPSGAIGLRFYLRASIWVTSQRRRTGNDTLGAPKPLSPETQSKKSVWRNAGC